MISFKCFCCGFASIVLEGFASAALESRSKDSRDDFSLVNIVEALGATATIEEIDAAVRILTSLRSNKSSKQLSALPPVLFVHKHTFASSDPVASADFAIRNLGGVNLKRPDHSCPQSPGVRQPIVRDLTLNGSSVALHFVYNPNKSPGSTQMNATDIVRHVDKMRGKFGQTNVFDQFMDNHVGMVVRSLDPYVRLWRTNDVPFICRTWCCGAGMPQFPEHCPAYSFNRTSGCEVGCYVEIPTGIIVELQCGVNGPNSRGGYNDSLDCLTETQPDIFDLCKIEGVGNQYMFA